MFSSPILPWEQFKIDQSPDRPTRPVIPPTALLTISHGCSYPARLPVCVFRLCRERIPRVAGSAILVVRPVPPGERASFRGVAPPEDPEVSGSDCAGDEAIQQCPLSGAMMSPTVDACIVLRDNRTS